MESDVWRIDYAKREFGFTLQPISGQIPAVFPTFDTPAKMREWAATHGYEMVRGDQDLWTEKIRNSVIQDAFCISAPSVSHWLASSR
jgi:hypothetical protein